MNRLNRNGFNLVHKLELFRFCLRDRTTRDSYRNLLALFVFEPHLKELPANFSTLLLEMNNKLQKWFGCAKSLTLHNVPNKFGVMKQQVKVSES